MKCLITFLEKSYNGKILMNNKEEIKLKKRNKLIDMKNKLKI